jgi:hypothetical protein
MISSLKSLLDYNIKDIDDNVIESSLEYFKNVKEEECKYGIIRVITSVLMSYKKCSDNVLNKYDECCEIYLKSVCSLLRQHKIHKWDDFAIANADCIIYNCKLYISRHCSSGQLDNDMCIAIFMIMTNLAYKDIIDGYFVYYGFILYNETDNEKLKVSIVYFLQNVYLDENWIDDDEFTDKYVECIQNFIRKYYINYPLLTMELLNDARILFPINTDWLDLILSLMEQNVEYYKVFERCVIYLNHIEDTLLLEYIVESTKAKMIINKAINTNDDYILYTMTNMFVNFTSCLETELPCEFYYNYIFKYILNRNVIDVYPKYILFGLSNILCEKENYSYINVNNVLTYVANVIKEYDDCQELCTEIYHILDNLRNALSFKEIIEHDVFMDAYARWDYMTDIKIYRITRMMFHYIAYNEEYHYMYKSVLNNRVMELAKDSYMYRRLINRYMNFSLEQKCAQLLYKMGKIDDEDLEALDITIY